jgi:hypothetical protein
MLPVEQPGAVAAALDSWLARVGQDDRYGVIDVDDSNSAVQRNNTNSSGAV